MKQFKINAFRTTKLSILGISSAEKAYKLCWELNEGYNYQLKSTQAHQVYLKNQSVIEFPLFVDQESEEEVNYYFLSNHSNGNTLSQQYHPVDYFFIVRGELEQKQLQLLKQQLSDIQHVQMVVPIDPEKIKHKERFIVGE